MKRVDVIGIGVGAGSITQEGLEAIERADALIGAPRMIDAFSHLKKPSFSAYMPKEILSVLNEAQGERFAVLFSGDVGFYSGASGLLRELEGYDARLIPGVSSVGAFFARLGLPWQDAALVSLHGTDADAVGPVRRNRLTFCLTGGNTRQIGAALCEAGYEGLAVRVGENLGCPQERVFSMSAKELTDAELASLTVLLIENPAPDARLRTGIPDGEFLRGGAPMTKAEARAFSLARLCIRPTDVLYDIGAGTGSVTVEMALAAHRGRVYAVEREEEALELVRENCRRFHIGNVCRVRGAAPDVLLDLPAPDAAFIGGSGGKMGEIVETLLSKDPAVRIVINAIAVESVHAALKAFERAGIEPEIVQILAQRAKKAGGLHLMTAQNPITVLSGGRHE